MSLVSEGRVVLQFHFPKDASLPLAASIYWRPATLAQGTDAWYADVAQTADRKKIVHEQVTFPNEKWLVCAKDSGEPLALYVTTDAPFQQCVVTEGSMKAAAKAGTRMVNIDTDLKQAVDASLHKTVATTASKSAPLVGRCVMINGLLGEGQRPPLYARRMPGCEPYHGSSQSLSLTTPHHTSRPSGSQRAVRRGVELQWGVWAV